MALFFLMFKEIIVGTEWIIVLGAVHTLSRSSKTCVIFVVFVAIDRNGQREIIGPRSHSKGFMLIFSSSLSDDKIIPRQHWGITERIESVWTNT